MIKFKKRNKQEMKWVGYQVTKMLAYPELFRKLIRGIKSRIYTVVSPLDVKVLKSSEPIPFNDRLNYDYEPIKIGGKWGKFFDCAWFNMKGQIDPALKGKHLVAIIDIQGEGCVMDSNGTPLTGLTRVLGVSDGLNSISGKKFYTLTQNAIGDEKVDLWVEGGNNGLFTMNWGSSKLKRAAIATVNDEMYNLYFDFLTLFQILISLDRDSSKYKEIMSSLRRAKKVLRRYSDTEVRQARDILAVELVKKSDDDFLYYVTGHAHLDLAWLWPIRETKRKAGRTLANQLKLIESFPEYIFCASQPQIYQWVKTMYPHLYDKVVKAVADGNIEPVGGMWVEPDCNVTSGESLVRQMLYGKRFFRKEFNKDMKICFLPDVFGFNGSLPQIIKKSGMEYFLTTKMSWNQYNEFPYHSCKWEGIDGSTILAHMPPAGNYNGDLTGYYINKTADNYKEKETKIACMLYGAGDGGGGASEVQLEMLSRQKNIEGVKKLKSSSVIDFFTELDKGRDKLPVWKGELFLEMHTGTLTTQAKTKYYNRKIENGLHDVETLATYAYFTKGTPYPLEKINEIWQELLLYQFHDILPGSSIKRVYDECVPRYAIMLETLESMKSDILDAIKENDNISVVNTTSFTRKEWVNSDCKWYLAEVDAYSSAKPVETDCSAVSYDEMGIYSDILSVKFWTDGSISSLTDKSRGKEYAGERLNRLAVYKDKKVHFNAWDLEPDYINNLKGYFKLLGYSTFVDGPRVVRRNFMSYGKSTLTQDIILTAGCPYVEFATTVDWQETHKMLRANFTPSVYSDQVTCDMQFGNIKRSTKTDDIVNYAQYEICAHKWVDVSSDGYGLSLLNDCKYGHRVKDGLISLNLLRSTVYPDKTADRGKQSFKYALYPHADDVKSSDITKLGYTFNNPMNVFDKGVKIDKFVTVDNDNIIIDTVKKAEDYEGIIVRLYESKGSTDTAKLSTSLAGFKAYEVNMIEDKLGDIDINKLSFTPFEIKSILLLREEGKAVKIIEEIKVEKIIEPIQENKVEKIVEPEIKVEGVKEIEATEIIDKAIEPVANIDVIAIDKPKKVVKKSEKNIEPLVATKVEEVIEIEVEEMAKVIEPTVDKVEPKKVIKKPAIKKPALKKE